MSPAEYTLGFVRPDGNTHDFDSFGNDRDFALAALRVKREQANPNRIHWFVYDADDPERGYFEP